MGLQNIIEGFARLRADLSPRYAAARAASDAARRMASFGVEQYDATRGRARQWTNRSLGNGSADHDLDSDTLHALRERSRDRFRNDGMARSTITSLAENIVGPGIHPRLRLDREALGLDEEQAAAMQRSVGRLWAEWCRTADNAGRSHFDMLQALVVASTFVSGDTFVRPVFRDDARVPARMSLRIEVLEADRVDDPDGMQLANLRGGVEISRRHGFPIAYWIADAHPGDVLLSRGNRTFRRIPAHTPDGLPNVLHVFAQQRPGQSRGEPLLAPVLNLFADAQDYVEAAVVRAHVAACFAAFVTRPNAWGYAQSRQTADSATNGQREEELSPGAVYYLNPGESVSFGQPPSDATFDQFVGFVNKRISAAVGQPYVVTAKDFSGTTYSAARAALIEAMRTYQIRRKWLAHTFLNPVWDLFLQEAWGRGLYPAGTAAEPFMVPDALGRPMPNPLWTQAEWIPSGGRGWIDPLKEAQAERVKLEMGVTTRDRIVAEFYGGTWDDDVVPQLEREAGRIPGLPSTDDPQQNAGVSEEATEDETDGDPEEEDSGGDDDGGEVDEDGDDGRDPDE